MDIKNKQIQQKNICQFCQTKIKTGEDFILCPSCTSSYHTDCWYENNGCAVYGCGYKVEENSCKISSFSIENILINAEYFINKKMYPEAVSECNRILNVKPDEIEAKRLYNKAVTSLNVRLKILADADDAFNRKDYSSAEIYYRNALLYMDESGHSFVNSRLQVISDALPALKRRSFYRKSAVYFLTAMIFLSVAFLGYYFIYLEEDRDFFAITRDDNFDDVLAMENQIFRYENFVRKYDKGNLRLKAEEKITALSSLIIKNTYKEDWKTALKYLGKIDERSNPKLRSDLFGMIYKVAEKEFLGNKSNAKNLNSLKKFIEAKSETEKALNIANYFPGTDLEKEKAGLNSNLNLLSKKISSLVKYKDIERELTEKLEELKRTKETESGNLVKVNAIIIEEKSPTYFLAKNIFNDNIFALKTAEVSYYKKGDVVILECSKSGKVNIKDEKLGEITVPLYKFGLPQNDNNSTASYDLESLIQRLDYLRNQRNKIDSLLSLGL